MQYNDKMQPITVAYDSAHSSVTKISNINTIGSVRGCRAPDTFSPDLWHW